MTTTAVLTFDVTADDTAVALGSGELAVLGTPRLVAWCEQATCAIPLSGATGATSVGTRIELDHLRASGVGERVEVRAELVQHDGRRLTFDVSATDSAGHVVGRGLIGRAVVDPEPFMARLG